MTFKQKIHRGYFSLLNDKIQALKNALNELNEGAKNDTKSTAGDKHETARAMMQIEQENINKQLQNMLEQKVTLEKIDPELTHHAIAKGTLIKTNRGHFFMSIALGKILVDNIEVIALSTDSPLGVKLMGLKANDTTQINGINYLIESVC